MCETFKQAIPRASCWTRAIAGSRRVKPQSALGQNEDELMRQTFPMKSKSPLPCHPDKKDRENTGNSLPKTVITKNEYQQIEEFKCFVILAA